MFAAAAWNDYDCQEAGRMDRRVGSRRNHWRAQVHRQAAEIRSRPSEAMERARISGKCVLGAKLDLNKCFDFCKEYTSYFRKLATETV